MSLRNFNLIFYLVTIKTLAQLLFHCSFKGIVYDQIIKIQSQITSLLCVSIHKKYFILSIILSIEVKQLNME